jgi:hypothetical protein
MTFKALMEELVAKVKPFEGLEYNIYKNPGKQEIDEAKKHLDGAIRYIVDFKGKNVYVFTASLLHSDASRKLNIDYNDKENYFFGIAEKVNGINFIKNWCVSGYNKKIFKKDWNFCKKYIDKETLKKELENDI